MLIVRSYPWGKIFFDPACDEFWAELQPGQTDPQLDHVLSVSCHLSSAAPAGTRRRRPELIVDDWLYYQDKLQAAGAMRLHLEGVERIPRTDATRIVRAGLSRGFGVVVSMQDCGLELERFPGFPAKTMLRTIVDPIRILDQQGQGGPSLERRIEWLRKCAVSGLSVSVLSPYDPFSPVLLIELGEALALAGVRQWHILPPRSGLGKELRAAALEEIRTLRKHLSWLEIRYGNPMEREQDLWIDAQGGVTLVERPEPCRISRGSVGNLVDGGLLTENFLGQHALSWVSWTLPSGEGGLPAPAERSAFISYNHADARLACKVHDFLEASGTTTWMDGSKLHPGDPWLKDIQRALDSCPVVIVCIGPAGFGDFQALEVTSVLGRAARGECRLIPVLLPGAQGHLPPLVDSFQYVDLRSLDAGSFGQLLRAVQGHTSVVPWMKGSRDRVRVR